MTPALAPPTTAARRWLWASVATMLAGVALGCVMNASLKSAVLFALPPVEALWLGVAIGQGANARLRARGVGRLQRRLARLGTALLALVATWAVIMLHGALLGASRDLGYAAETLGPIPLVLLWGAALVSLCAWVWLDLRQDGASPAVAAGQTGVVLLVYALFAALVANPVVVFLVACAAPGSGGCSDM